MLTLETTMLTAFGDANTVLFRQIILGATGVVVSVFTISIAIFMIVKATKKLKLLKQDNKNYDKLTSA